MKLTSILTLLFVAAGVFVVACNGDEMSRQPRVAEQSEPRPMEQDRTAREDQMEQKEQALPQRGQPIQLTVGRSSRLSARQREQLIKTGTLEPGLHWLEVNNTTNAPLQIMVFRENGVSSPEKVAEAQIEPQRNRVVSFMTTKDARHVTVRVQSPNQQEGQYTASLEAEQPAYGE
ncbi:MAG: hypothetical protein ACLFVU_05625 [Phycisphaerae bacterium]